MTSTGFEHKDTKSTKDTKDVREYVDGLSNRIIGAAIEVHRILGPGLLEAVYEEALCHELKLHGLAVERQLLVPIEYKGLVLRAPLRLDVQVEKLVLIEVKAVERLEQVHEAQLLSYLRLTDTWLGLLINFNVAVLKNGVRRVVNGDPIRRSL